VVKDGNLITANGPGHAMDFALKLLDHLAGSEKAEEIRKGLNI
jgi:putative intracellular protease/amidase